MDIIIAIIGVASVAALVLLEMYSRYLTKEHARKQREENHVKGLFKDSCLGGVDEKRK